VAKNRVVVVLRDADLTKVVQALSSAGRFTSRLHCWQEQAYQDANDRDHDQEFHERKTSKASSAPR
jgi:hypothetical protein